MSIGLIQHNKRPKRQGSSAYLLLDSVFLSNFALVIKRITYYELGKTFPTKGRKIMVSLVISAVVVAALVAKAVSVNNHIAA